MDLHLILLLAIIIATETAAQFFLQKNSESKDKTIGYLLAGIGMYALVGYIYSLILSGGFKLALANSVWNAGSELTVAVVGWLMFNQKLTTKQLFGIVVTIVGLNIMGVE